LVPDAGIKRSSIPLLRKLHVGVGDDLLEPRLVAETIEHRFDLQKGDQLIPTFASLVQPGKRLLFSPRAA